MATNGTYLLDGLLQGASPGDDALEDWLRQCGRGGLEFSLDTDGHQFSLLASNAEKKIAHLPGGNLQAAMTGALEAFVGLYGEGSKPALYSTLRSREFRSGAEIQTLYFIQADGEVTSQSRKIGNEAPPPPPEPPKKRKQRLLLQGCAMLAGLLVLGIASLFFINWGELFHKTKLMVQPAQGVTLDDTVTSEYFKVALTSVKQLDGYVELEVTRGPQWTAARATDLDEPVSVSGLVPAAATGSASPVTWRSFLALQAVKRGYVLCCFYDLHGIYCGETVLPLDQLNGQEKFVVQISIPRMRALLNKLVVKP